MTISELVFAVTLVAAVLSIGRFALVWSAVDRSAVGQTASSGRAFFLHWRLWAMGPAERVLLKWRVSPTTLNFASVATAGLAGLSIAIGGITIGGWLILLAGALDILDGRIARSRGIASPFGEFFDSTLDRFGDALVFAGVAVVVAAVPSGALLATLAASGSLLVSFVRARAESVGVSCTGGVMQRAERLTLMAFACLAGPTISRLTGIDIVLVLLVATGIVAAGSLATAVYRTGVVARQLQERSPAPDPIETPDR